VQRPKNQRLLSKKRTPAEVRDWAFTRERIGQKLKKLYQACATDELPPRLLAALKKLDEERPELSMERVQVIRETKSSPMQIE
jgi:hypothetical protein